MDATPGILALVGGGEWQEGCDFDAALPGRRGHGPRCWCCPPPRAYEHPERLVVRAGEWFAPLGGQVEGLMVLNRADAENDGAADIMRRARLIYLAGSSPMHVRSVLKHSAVWDALVAAWRDGAVVVGSSGAAMALTDPMVDARGRRAHDRSRPGRRGGRGAPLRRRRRGRARGRSCTVRCCSPRRDTPVVGIPERTALIRDPDGTWRSAGAGRVAVFLGGAPAPDGLASLPA